MSKADLHCPGCDATLRLNERESRRAGKLIYDCRTCDRRYSLRPREVELVEETVPEDSGSRTQPLRALRAPGESGVSRLTEVLTPSATAALPEGLGITLDFTDGPHRGRSVRVSLTKTVIGREEADIEVSDTLVSRRHAVIEVFDPETIILKDLTSTNGTYHNGRLIDHCKLQDGDEIRLGSSILAVAIEKSG